jgi:hypothetical protein
MAGFAPMARRPRKCQQSQSALSQREKLGRASSGSQITGHNWAKAVDWAARQQLWHRGFASR